jgi:hypothetical protein
VWAIIVTHGASVFGYFTVVNQLPTYMKHILHFNIKAVSCRFGLQVLVSLFVDLYFPVSSPFFVFVFLFLFYFFITLLSSSFLF